VVILKDKKTGGPKEMKRILLPLVLLLIGSALFAQSLRDTEEYKKMQEAKIAYQEAYDRGDFEAAYTHAREIRRYAEILDRMAQEKITGVAVVTPPEDDTVPPGDYIASYTVKPGDCLWAIAGRTDVFGDSWKWQEIWKVNKSKLADPENPRLIHPGTKFDIPSLRGETRTGSR
jgi:nucleoid-associated protein YgaU